MKYLTSFIVKSIICLFLLGSLSACQKGGALTEFPTVSENSVSGYFPLMAEQGGATAC